MRLFTTVILVMGMALASKAQTVNRHFPANVQKHHKALMQLLQQNQVSRSAYRTTTATIDTLQYLIAQRTRDSMANMTDSVNLTWGSSKLCTYDYNDMLYPFNYPYNTSPMFNFKGNFTVPFLHYLTFDHWTVDPTTLVYGYFETWQATYNAHNDITGFSKTFADSTLYQNMSFVNVFSASNTIDTGYWFNELAGTPDSAFQQYFSYNTAGKISEDSVYEYHAGRWYIVSKSYYTYDGLGDLTQIDFYANDTDTTFSPSFPEQTQYINTYNSSHQLITVATAVHNGTSLQPFATDTFVYAPGAAFHDIWIEWEYDMINSFWTPYFTMTKYLNAEGLPDTVLVADWDSVAAAYLPASMYVATYNVYNNPDTLKEYDYNYTYYPATPSYNTVYYYNTYYDTTIPAAVQPMPVANSSAMIYPVPAKNELNFQISVSNDQPIMAVITNIIGQRVMKQQIFTNGGKAAIDVFSLMPGTYGIEVIDRSGRSLIKQLFNKE